VNTAVLEPLPCTDPKFMLWSEDGVMCLHCRAEGTLRWAEWNAGQWGGTSQALGPFWVLSTRGRLEYFDGDWRNLDREGALVAIRERIT
jgi:hypothetical protein